MTLALVSVTLLTETGRTVAAEHVVNMLTNGDSGSMVFEPAFVKVAVGDTIVFNPVAPNQFHNSASQFLPEGATSWSSTFDTEFRLTVETEGVYIYSCVPHQGMGMVGVIQVGAATNLAGAKTAAEELSSKMFQNKERLTAALAQAN
ncbi:MAG: plastocyanin/azurin family copper-binding protein [Pseudomonadota bacterium]